MGQYGDYVTTFLNSFVLQDVELIKGPGAASPTISRAIGGTVNFRTLDPTSKPWGTVTLGVDSYGGDFSNFGYSTTVGRFGVLADYAINGTPGPLSNTPFRMALDSGVYTVIDSRGKTIALPSPTVTLTHPMGQYNTRNEASTSLLFCCANISTTFTNKNELLKLRYNLSPTTSLTASYLGSQTYSDQNGNNGNRTTTVFAPGAGYTGSVAAGGQVIVDPDNFGAPAHEINNEPIFQAEVRSALGKDSVLGRYYTASISRLQYGSNHNPTGNNFIPAAIYGGGTNGTPVFNGADPYGNPYTLELTGANAYYDSSEEDKLRGESLEYDHLLGPTGDTVSLSYDTNHAQTHSYSFASQAATVPAGSTQDTTTLLLRGMFTVDKLNVTASDYLTNFRSRFGVYKNAFSSSQTLSFQNQDLWHEDARLGVVFRPNASTSVRASAGSAVAPPYLGALVADTFAPQLCGPNTSPCPVNGAIVAVDSESNPGLKAETSFGYDLGADIRSKDGVTVVTGDLYLTNLHNQLVKSTYINGTAVVGGATLPLYTTGYTNVSNARYSGIELGVRRDPAFGLGYTVQGALLRAYPYNISPVFYATSGGQATTNLGVVSNINFGSYQTISNQAIPYSQGYGELRYRSRHGELFAFGETYYGANNSVQQRAFLVSNATARTTISRQTYLQVSIDNLFNIYPDPIPSEYVGVGQVLANNEFVARNADVIGPRTVRLSITRNFGRR